MSDYFTFVERQLCDAASALARETGVVQRVPAPRRRHGATVVIAAGAAVAVAVFVAGILLVGGRSDRRGVSPVGATPLVEWRDPAAGLSVRLPATWHRATSSLTPHLIDPVERLSAGTYPLREGPPRSCAQVPVAALQAAGPRDVFFTLTERVASAHARFAPRRTPLRLGPPVLLESRGCVAGPVPWREHIVSFSDAGRQFSILAVIGTRASVTTRRQLQAAIDSLRFTAGKAPHLPARH